MFSEISINILKVNGVLDNPEKQKEFIKSMRYSLRFDYEMTATEVRKLNDNKVIETWYRFHSLPGNRIGGQ